MKWSLLRWFVRLVLPLILAPYLLLQNRAPTSTLSWLWALLGLPYVGPLAFLLFGSDRMVRQRVKKVREVHEHDPKDPLDAFSPAAEKICGGLDDADRALFNLLARVNETPTSTADDVRLLIDAQTFYPALLRAIGEARRHVHIEFFIYQRDRYGRQVLAALLAARARGVEVRLLLDQGGCQHLSAKFFQPLIDAGGKFAWFRSINPLRNRWAFNLKNHRKLQIIDGTIAFVGGMNLGREYMGEDPRYGGWRDAQVELRGDVASALQRVFADDWFFATDEKLLDDHYFPEHAPAPERLVQVVYDGPDIPEDRIQMTVVALLNAAKERAWLTAGYFVPHEPLLTALQLAAARGVDVRLLVSEKCDHPYLVQVGRSFYEALMKYGVRIFEYAPEKGINHAKVVTVDGRWLMIGSANFDIRSMRLNFELNVALHDAELVAQMDGVLRDDTEKDSDEIQLDEFRRRPFKQRLTESIYRPLAPLL